METLRTFAAAEAFLAAGRTEKSRSSRLVQRNTRLIRLHPDRIAVRLHATDVVVMHRDGTFTVNTGHWFTVTTRDRITSYSPVRIYSVRGTWTIPHEDDPVSPPKVWKCRTCKGDGRTARECYGPRWCYPHWDATGARACDHGHTGGHRATDTCEHGFHGRHAGGTAGWDKCWRCHGEGRADYGSNRIPYEWTHGRLRIDATGMVIGPEDTYTGLGDTEPATRTATRRSSSWITAVPATPLQRATRPRSNSEQLYTPETEPTQVDIVARIQREVDEYERLHGAPGLYLETPAKIWADEDETDPFAVRFC